MADAILGGLPMSLLAAGWLACQTGRWAPFAGERVMHHCLSAVMMACTLFGYAAVAATSDTLRVGNRVLVVGDSAATVIELLGKPSHTSHRKVAHGGKGSSHRGKRTRAGKQWQYRREGRLIVVTLVNGRVSDIDELSR